VCVLTTGRQDYGILRSTLLLLHESPRFQLSLVAGGMHLRDEFGRTIERIREDGLPIARALDFVGDLPEPAGDAARALASISGALADLRPDMLVIVGDRSETLAAAHAAALHAVPVVHLHGGEETEGAVDNLFRHAITKLSHLHLVSSELHAQRVRQMGEAPERIVIVGAPGLDNRFRPDLPSLDALRARLGDSLAAPIVLVTVHPTTLSVEESPLAEVSAVAGAMEQVRATYVISQPNSDAGGPAIRDFWSTWAPERDRVLLVDALGDASYWSLLLHADAVLGNSSSGIIEAPAVGVPVVDVGDRQRGRERSPLVRNVPPSTPEIVNALSRALAISAERSRTARPETPERSAAARVFAALTRWEPQRPPRKSFASVPVVCDP
jgi:UDP-hydrolysing UDP-N-acetyl-D-glucosamine 2-epimerase